MKLRRILQAVCSCFILMCLIDFWVHLSCTDESHKVYGLDGLKRRWKKTEANRSVTPPPGGTYNQMKPFQNLTTCPDISPHLVGPFKVEFNLKLSLDTLRRENPNLQFGGRYSPPDCISSQKVAIIIPFRNRSEHLLYWLHYLHPFLQRQQIDYGVYIINQDGDRMFNKGKLMNAGYKEALKEDNYDCFVFHDVDLIPMDDRNTYKCFNQPRHLAVALDKFGFRLAYNTIFGGVTSLSKEQLLKINGFSNQFWGWGGEDDAIYHRLYYRQMSISRPDHGIAKYKMIKHGRDRMNEPNPRRFVLMDKTRWTMDKDGLNSLYYDVVEIKKNQLFTFITINVGSLP